MRRATLRLAFSCPVLFGMTILAVALAAQAQDVLTYHNNNSRTGFDNKETMLTLSNVNANSFGKLFEVKADGLVDAEPLYLSNVEISGVNHNLLLVVTENDTVAAHDADTGASLWHVSALEAGETPSDDHSCNLVKPQIGITSTPVISRPKTGNPIIYLVAMSKDSAGDYHQRLHALDATNGAELMNGPVDITAQYPGTGDNSSDGYVIFDPGQYVERAALLLAKNTVYLGWASHCDWRPYTAWVMGYDASTLAQTSVLNLTPNGAQGGIWSSGGGMAADNEGNVFLLDGNGVFDTTLDGSGFPSEGDYGNAFLRLSGTGGLAVADYFEMYNEAYYNSRDTDLGSGGAMLVDEKDSTGKAWHLAIGAGKDENIYIVDQTNMGKFNSSSNLIYQQVSDVLEHGMWAVPAAMNASIYFGPKNSPILKFEFSNAKLGAQAAAETANAFGYPGATPSLSSNGSQNAILWAAENTNPAVLHAYNANTLVEIYNSNQASNGRDHFGDGNKFITPMIANGKVYVGTTTGVGVLGLLSEAGK